MQGDILKQSLDRTIYEGDVCALKGMYKNALCWYNRGLKKDKDNIILLTKKGNAYCNLRRYTQAYECYVKALIHAKALDVINQYVERYQTPLGGDINTLYELLRLKYNIPITMDGLQLVLKKALEEYDESKRVSEWLTFKKILNRKKFDAPAKYVDMLLRHFGESSYRHFLRFYCYLSGEKRFSLSMDEYADIIQKQIKEIKLNQFERFLKTGKKQPLLNRMTGEEFVDFLVDLFENKGYYVKKNPPSYDYGADLITRRFEETVAVQVKSQKQPVGINAVQEVEGARGYYRTQKAVVVSVSGFTNSAVKLANRLGVELWDRKKIVNELSKSGF